MATWWRHQMDTFSALPAICEGNPPVIRGFPSQRPVTRMFSLVYAWTNDSANNRAAGDLRPHRAHYAATVMKQLTKDNPHTAVYTRDSARMILNTIQLVNPKRWKTQLSFCATGIWFGSIMGILFVHCISLRTRKSWRNIWDLYYERNGN